MSDDTNNQVTYYAAWIKKSQINYFACFMELWVGFNAWYKYRGERNQDRQAIEWLKGTDISSDKLYEIFSDLMDDETDKKAIAFRANMEGLYYALNASDLRYNFPGNENNHSMQLSFNSSLISHERRRDINSYVDISNIDLDISRIESENEDLEDRDHDAQDHDDYDTVEEKNVIRLGTLELANEQELLFTTLVEVLYQVRCQLVHGTLDPDDDGHYDTVKYCYEILYVLASSLDR